MANSLILNSNELFQEMLMKSLCGDDDDTRGYEMMGVEGDKSGDETKMMLSIMEKSGKEEELECLISGEKLEDKSVLLKCNHYFNYDCLYNEVYRQQNIMHEVEKGYIKCPYCRKKTKGVLPYKSGYQKITYVNWPGGISVPFVSLEDIRNILKKRELMIEKRKLKEAAAAAKSKESNEIMENKCPAILVSGINKGKPCGCALNNGNKYCGRHIKLQTSS